MGGKFLSFVVALLSIASFLVTSCGVPPVAALVKTSPTSEPATPTKVAASPTSAPTATPLPGPTPTPRPDPASVKANELGKIPIFEYHLIGKEEDRWERRYDNFRRDLERLYAAGYTLISLNDVIENRINVPAGRSPAILTFDDSSPGQFTFVQKDGKLVPDEYCAVGILQAFYEKHPDFGMEATFYVLPAADPPHDLFGQKEYKMDKLRYIVEHGMDIGNHTYWHQALGDLGDADVQKQLGMAVKVIKEAVPNYEVTSLALPLGVWSRNKALVKSGSYQGTAYRNKAVLLVGAEPAPSPNSVDYDPYALPRIQAIQEQLDFWLRYLEKTPNERYVSDGDRGVISFPKAIEKRFNPKAAGSMAVRTY
ncbi:MAG: polysaccharide deacetylase family protein [Chloroflexi bacterium]|nr:polysaccharide deacetylase family protein [Chloroflexota bacterium]